MKLKDVISPERIALASAYTEEEAREEAFSLLMDMEPEAHLAGCKPGQCADDCGVFFIEEQQQLAQGRIDFYRGVKCS